MLGQIDVIFPFMEFFYFFADWNDLFVITKRPPIFVDSIKIYKQGYWKSFARKTTQPFDGCSYV